MKKVLIFLAVALLSVLGFTAFLSSMSLIIDPSGQSLALSEDLLSATPFNSYLVPGIVILIAIGVPSLLIAAYTVQKKKFYPTFIFIQGFILILCLLTEVLINNSLMSTGLLYGSVAVGIVLILISLMIVRMEKTKIA